MSTDAAIAANRFGFGARPGDLARLGSHAREALLAQLDGAAPLLTDPALPARGNCWHRRTRSANRRWPVAAARPAPDPRNPQCRQAARLAQLLREVFLPAYTADVGARARAGHHQRAGFPRAPGAVLEQPLRGVRRQGRGAGTGRNAGARGDPAACAGQFHRHAAGGGTAPGHAAVPGQPAVHRSELAARAGWPIAVAATSA